MADNKFRYVVAASQSEADSLAAEYGWESRAEAIEHLKLVKAPPTDPFYANKYGVYVSKLTPAPAVNQNKLAAALAKGESR